MAQAQGYGGSEELTIHVRKGVKVHVVEDAAEGRDLSVDMPSHFRVAVKRVQRGGAAADAAKVGPIFLCG